MINKIISEKKQSLVSRIKRRQDLMRKWNLLEFSIDEVYNILENKILSIADFVKVNNDILTDFNIIYSQYLEDIKKLKIFSKDFIIFDIQEKKAIFTNIDNYNSIDYLSILNNKKEIFIEDGKTWFKFINYDENWEYSYLIIYLENQEYSLEELKKDLLYYYLFIILSLFLIYFVWFKLISYIFKPIESNINDMESFTHNAWHELNTPLTNISSSVQLLKEMWEYDEEIVNEIIWEVNKSSWLIDTLKNISNIDTMWEYKTLLVSNKIKEIIKSLENISENKKINININLLEDFELKVQENHFYSLFYNLISNSIKYNNINWNIKIIINKNTIIIEDNWVWIKKENLDKIFIRFYREQEHRNNEWLWLWLSIVNKIIEINNWDIDIKSEVWVWTTIKIKF
jgi:signal transduction histidine kinase